MNDIFIAPPGKNASGYVELSSPSLTRKAQGRVFEKQILKMGPLFHRKAKGGKIDINDAFVDELISNFNNGTCDIVQMTVVDKDNNHTEDPLRNIGEVIGLTKRDGKVFAQVDVRDESAAPKMGKTLIGGSAALALDYEDTDTLTRRGPTLTHLAVTNRPYVLGLETYREVIALSADGRDDSVLLLSSEKETPVTREELIALAQSDFGIDIAGLEATAAEHDADVALSAAIQSELAGSGVLTLSNGAAATADDLIAAVGETVKQNITLSAAVDTLEEGVKLSAATSKVESLIRVGKILPVNKEGQIELLLSNEALFEKLLPEKAIVDLEGNNELGTIPLSNGHDMTVASEVDRVMANARAFGIVPTKA